MANANNPDMHEMHSVLQEQLERVQALSAFLSLKEAEAMSGGEYTMISYMTAKQELEIEKSLLAGHAHMLQARFREQNHSPTPKTKQLLQNVLNLSLPS